MPFGRMVGGLLFFYYKIKKDVVLCTAWIL